LCASIFLLLEFLLVANLAGANAQVAYAGHEVEPDFGSGVAGDAALQDRDDLLGEVGRCACAVGNGSRLEAVKFVEGVVYRRVAVLLSVHVTCLIKDGGPTR
jgi:hypothetical protein